MAVKKIYVFKIATKIPLFCSCVSLVGPDDVCDDSDEMKIVNSELGRSRLECTSSKMADSKREKAAEFW